TTMLQDGRVLVVGTDGLGHLAAETYDSGSATWMRQTDPPRQRIGPATLLPDGRVFFLGDASFENKTSDIFDPSAGRWSLTAEINVPRWNGKVAALPDGRVLIAGGVGLGSIDPLLEAEIYDSASDTWIVTGSMVRGLPWFAMTTLPDGTVLAVGGGYDDITSE